jgi:hypothetical protein
MEEIVDTLKSLIDPPKKQSEFWDQSKREDQCYRFQAAAA